MLSSGQCESLYQLYECFLPFWLARTSCQVHEWKTFFTRPIENNVQPITLKRGEKKHSQDYLPKGYQAYYSMTLQLVYPDIYCIKQ